DPITFNLPGLLDPPLTDKSNVRSAHRIWVVGYQETCLRCVDPAKLVIGYVYKKRPSDVHCHFPVLICGRWHADEFSFHELVTRAVIGHRHQVVSSNWLCNRRAHKYSSTLR